MNKRTTATKSRVRTMLRVCKFGREFVQLTTLLSVTIVVCFSMLISNYNLNGSNKNLIQFAESTTTTTTATNATTTATKQAYWHRPGCFQVGHTRTISIPGCVKFNLSTNACRGFCMSFSIPFNEDIGPPPIGAEQTSGQSSSDQMTPTTPTSSVLLNDAALYQQIAATLNGNNNNQDGEQEAGSKTKKRKQLMIDISSGANPAGLSSSSASLPGSIELAHLGGSQKSPLSGTIGNLNDKSDVVSVSQCCNMMETEDVTVNLRCGLNETRKLVFKSAKTCECFFCKHV